MKVKKLFQILTVALLSVSCTNDIETTLKESDANSNENFVTLEEALKTAENVFTGVYGKSATRAGRFVSSVENYCIGNESTRSGDETPDFYIVNYGN